MVEKLTSNFNNAKKIFEFYIQNKLCIIKFHTNSVVFSFFFD